MAVHKFDSSYLSRINIPKDLQICPMMKHILARRRMRSSYSNWAWAQGDTKETPKIRIITYIALIKVIIRYATTIERRLIDVKVAIKACKKIIIDGIVWIRPKYHLVDAMKKGCILPQLYRNDRNRKSNIRSQNICTTDRDQDNLKRALLKKLIKSCHFLNKKKQSSVTTKINKVRKIRIYGTKKFPHISPIKAPWSLFNIINKKINTTIRLHIYNSFYTKIRQNNIIYPSSAHTN